MKMLILETKSNENIRIRQAVKNGYTELTAYPSVVDLSYPTSKTRRGRVQSMNERERERERERESERGTICPTITTTGGLYVFEEIK